ncbi:MAG: hypothetical protein DRP06_01740 [Candidatus Aenigmatarchaeota archaeon]|nr:MAG: hypothetical protein DRP06_01740 [Candidatus Aenigmarchaeota archaeon]
MWGDSLIKNTDLELTFEEHLDYLKKVIPYSKNDGELITNYVNQYENAVAEGKLRCHCSMDNIKFIVALAVGYENRIAAEEAKMGDYMVGNLIETAKKEIYNNLETKETAEKVYSLLEPNLEDYKFRFRINEEQIKKSLSYMEV